MHQMNVFGAGGVLFTQRQMIQGECCWQRKKSMEYIEQQHPLVEIPCPCVRARRRLSYARTLAVAPCLLPLAPCLLLVAPCLFTPTRLLLTCSRSPLACSRSRSPPVKADCEQN